MVYIVAPERIWKWGHRSGAKVWGYRSSAKRRKNFFRSCPSTFWPL